MKIERIGKYSITFTNGRELSAYHEQDCCEEVYADFGSMKVMPFSEEDKALNAMDARHLTFFEDLLESVVPIEGVGFYLVTKEGRTILVPCYDRQNGYYSNNLTLYYSSRAGTVIEEKDISGCTEPDY